MENKVFNYVCYYPVGCLYFDFLWIRTGESRGFAFVRYKYADEAQDAVDKLDGTCVYIF